MSQNRTMRDVKILPVGKNMIRFEMIDHGTAEPTDRLITQQAAFAALWTAGIDGRKTGIETHMIPKGSLTTARYMGGSIEMLTPAKMATKRTEQRAKAIAFRSWSRNFYANNA
jgi:hypothetical protein